MLMILPIIELGVVSSGMYSISVAISERLLMDDFGYDKASILSD
jgi:hypothetical protein